MPNVLEVFRWMIPGFVIAGLMLLNEEFRAKSLGYKAMYYLAIFVGLGLIHAGRQWLTAAGYKQELDFFGIALIWFGPAALLCVIGVAEWRYGVALLKEKRSPLPGWKGRYDNCESNESEAVSYGKSRKAMALTTFGVAGIWFLGGAWLFVA